MSDPDLVAARIARTMASALASLAQKLLADARHLEGEPRRDPNRRRKAARRTTCDLDDEVDPEFAERVAELAARLDDAGREFAARHFSILAELDEGDSGRAEECPVERMRRAADILEGAEPTPEEIDAPWVRFVVSQRMQNDASPLLLRLVAACVENEGTDPRAPAHRFERTLAILRGSPPTPDEEGAIWAQLALSARPQSVAAG